MRETSSEIMSIDKVRELYNTQPFHPFTMHLADGRRIDVQSRECMAAAPNGRTVVVYQPDNKRNIVDLLLITDVEVELARPTPRSDENDEP
jgi:hypothetical protein